ncbi:flagellar export chaperone FliS [Cohnella phaseoli]|uniref:Flagellar secretion chaperone FliS n=1 Tax=Cohnella phaseoli TaxID=456490 RepID=A0A3D9KC64_9BACL|nr:flagellar export chaperone FliS [Cohnella phaseoli]RED83988.1 flagellar protein FliS [Cohnella phaseoli]
MNTNPFMKYQQTAVQTSGPQLLLMLYDGAIRFTRAGIEGIQQRNMQQSNTNLIKAQQVIHELVASLNFEYELSHNLVQIYEYMIHQLITANTRKETAPAQEALNHLLELKATWITAIRKSAQAEAQQT